MKWQVHSAEEDNLFFHYEQALFTLLNHWTCLVSTSKSSKKAEFVCKLTFILWLWPFTVFNISLKYDTNLWMNYPTLNLEETFMHNSTEVFYEIITQPEFSIGFTGRFRWCWPDSGAFFLLCNAHSCTYVFAPKECLFMPKSDSIPKDK